MLTRICGICVCPAGFGGQKFIESQVGKIRALKNMCLERVSGHMLVGAGQSLAVLSDRCADACVNLLATVATHSPCRTVGCDLQQLCLASTSVV